MLPFWDIIVGLERFPTFDLETSICNHGFFMMAPNRWDPSSKSFSRPLRLADPTTSLMTTISQPLGKDRLLIRVFGRYVLLPKDEQAIKVQAGRMLRLSDKDEEDMIAFYKLLPDAKAKRFGRLFRSPSLFEDVAKSLLLCCCPWNTSLDLAKALCDLNHMSRRKKEESLPWGDFPSPEELARCSEKELIGKGKFGYRACNLISLAKEVVAGKIKLSESNKYIGVITKFNGVGPFTVHTIMMCVGCYNNIPIDSETMRHMEEVHGLKKPKRKRGSTGVLAKTRNKIQEKYEIYNPFQCLAYWFELVNSYERKLGKTLSELQPSKYHCVSGTCEQ